MNTARTIHPAVMSSIAMACVANLAMPEHQAYAAPGQVCVDPVITGVTAQWDDGGGSPWAAAEPALLVDGDVANAWHYSGQVARRVHLTLPGQYDVTGVQYNDNWGNGSLVLDADAIDNSNETTISTDHYPLGWHSELFTSSNTTSVYMYTTGSTKLNELQFCGKVSQVVSGSSSSSGGGSGSSSSSSSGGGSGSGSGGTTPGNCTAIPNVTASWASGWPAPSVYHAGEPSLLVDNSVSQDWYYYWLNSGAPTPVVFTLPGNYNLDAIYWQDSFGAADMIFTAGSQTRTVSTNRWPLAAHTDPWVVNNVSQISMITSGNDFNISEITFCGTPTTTIQDTIAPVPVSGLSTNPSCNSASLNWIASLDFNNNGPNGTASTYRLQSPGLNTTTVSTNSAQLSGLSTQTTYSGTIVAIDSTGNESAPVSFTFSTPQCQTGADPWAATVNIIDSFGQQVVPDDSGPQWNAIRAYYDTYYASANFNWQAQGMCSQDIHNSYWVYADGDYYPTWHPTVHNPGQIDECWFMHDHGEDPRQSPLYDLDDALSIGVPFGYAHMRMGNMGQSGSGMRAEDHVGHKSIVQNNYTLVRGNPFGPDANLDELGVTCNWLSKIHQGSYSDDALGNNLHEYFLNMDCDANPAYNINATKVRIKELATWGSLDKVFDENCLSDWLWVGNITTGPRLQPGTGTHPASDGKREFGCFETRVGATHNAGAFNGMPHLLSELWKPDGEIKAPDNAGTVIFSPYYVTRNPGRYIDHQWKTRFNRDNFDTYLGRGCTGGDTNGNPADNCMNNTQCTELTSTQQDGCEGPGGMISTLDLCVRGSDVWNLSLLSAKPEYANTNNYPNFCALLDTGLQQTFEQQIAASTSGDTLQLSEQRRLHPDNPFNGTIRGVHPKRIQMYQSGSTQTNYRGMKVFCTNAFGEASEWPDMSDPNNPTCPGNLIMQALSPENNNWNENNIDGSSVGARINNGNNTLQQPGVTNEQGLLGGGEGGEFVIDNIRTPGNKVRLPN